jgi:hypothetical protein
MQKLTPNEIIKKRLIWFIGSKLNYCFWKAAFLFKKSEKVLKNATQPFLCFYGNIHVTWRIRHRSL